MSELLYHGYIASIEEKHPLSHAHCCSYEEDACIASVVAPGIPVPGSPGTWQPGSLEGTGCTGGATNPARAGNKSPDARS